MGLQGDGVTQCGLYYATIQRGSTRGNLDLVGFPGGWHDACYDTVRQRERKYRFSGLPGGWCDAMRFVLLKYAAHKHERKFRFSRLPGDGVTQCVV